MLYEVITVGAFDHAVLVIAEIGGAEPEVALLFVDVALVGQRLQRLVDVAVAGQRAFGEPDLVFGSYNFV